MTNWKEYKLEELCVKITDGSHSSPKEAADGKRKIATVKDMLEFDFNYPNCKRISEEEYLKLLQNDCKPLKDDILFSKDGTIGKIIIFNGKEDLVILSSIAILRPNIELVNPRFLAYFLKSDSSQKDIIDNYRSGSVIPRVILKDFKRFPVNIPDLSTQTAIAEILSSLDDKIELNNKINQELENLAQTLFRQWFIDFEFPNENGDPYKSSGGEMIDSELGEIPENFTISILSEQTELVRGISYRKPELVSKEEGLPFVNLKCFALNGTFRQDGLKYFNGKYKEKHIIQPNDILVAVTDLTQDRVIIGLPILWNEKEVALPSLDVCIVRNEHSALKHFLYYEFKTFRYKSRIIEFANGSTVLHLSVKGLETYEYALPNDDVLIKWNEVISPILDQINNNIRENQELTNLRDTLLPKLISGELEVNEI